MSDEATGASEEKVDPRTVPHAVIHQGIPAAALNTPTPSASSSLRRDGRTVSGPLIKVTGEQPQRRFIRASGPYSPGQASSAVPRVALVAIVDRETLFRTMVVDALSHVPDLKVVASLDSVVKARDALSGRRIDLLIVDVEQRDGSGAVLAAELQKLNPWMRVLLLTRHDVSSLIESTKRHLRRPWSYLSKLSNIGREGLLEAVRRAAQDQGSSNAPPAERKDPFANLTGQQMAVLRLVADGYTNDQVGEHLGLSRRTVENHLLQIYRNLDIAEEEINPRVTAVLILLSHTLKL